MEKAKVKKASQTITGKAFEYALLRSFYDRLANSTEVEVLDTPSGQTALRCFESLDEKLQNADLTAAKSAVDFLLGLEPHLAGGEGVLQLEIVADAAGEEGDVRDVLAIRQSLDWAIGVSAKHHHRAVKHPRLSASIDFGAKWLGIPCSSEYMCAMAKIFTPLAERKKQSSSTARWDELGDYHASVYAPVLDAFVSELSRIDKEHPQTVAPRLISYLIGREDFYKVIKQKDRVEIQAYNIRGTLNKAFKHIKPSAKVPLLRLPKRILDISYADASATTILIVMDEGWQMSLRIHNASSRIEPSLKFDINLVSAPHTLFVHQILLD